MKKLFLLTIITCLLITSCETSSESLVNDIKETSFTSKDNKGEETPLIRKASTAFNKVIQNEEAWDELKTMIPSDIDNNTGSTSNHNVFFIEEFLIEDYIILKGSWVFENTTIGELFVNSYNSIYPDETIDNYSSILKNLPKLYLGIPAYALIDYDLWKEKGFPIALKSYNASDNKLTKISKEEVINNIGNQNYKDLTQDYEQDELSFYFYKENETTSIIAAKNKKGRTIILKDGEANISSFIINDNGHYNSFDIVENGETYTLTQGNSIIQSFVGAPTTPNLCDGFYAYFCDDPRLVEFLNQQQDIANKTCTTFKYCLTCCERNVGISYSEILFTPENIFDCAIANETIQMLDMYSLVSYSE